MKMTGISWPRLKSRSLDLAKRDLVIAPVVELGRLRGLVTRHYLRLRSSNASTLARGDLVSDFKKFE